MTEREGPRTSRRRQRERAAGASRAAARISIISFTATDVFENARASIDQALEAAARPGMTWINVDGFGDPEVLARLGQRFGLHPLALEDALSVSERPKIEVYSNHYFLVMRTVRLSPDLEEEQVSMFFGAGFLITIQERSDGDVFEPVRDAIRKDRGRIRSRGSDFLAYSILDAVCDAFFPVIEALGERVDRLEDAALVNPSPATLREVQALRHDAQRMRHVVWPMREELAVLQREHTDHIAPETLVFLRDTYDHAIQSLEMIEAYRETISAIMEVYLSAQNQRLNEVMKVLTVIATLFIPLTFIAGIYGMNFQHMPELQWRSGYAATVALMLAVAGGMIVYFRRRGWW
jgi:magnesium transporter